jgi:hypothetical protein
LDELHSLTVNQARAVIKRKDWRASVVNAISSLD